MHRMLATFLLLMAMALEVGAAGPPDGALWNRDRTAAVSSVHTDNGSVVTAYVRQQDGTFLTFDLSAVEGGNFGKLGRSRKDFDRFETTPIEWLQRQDGLLQVRIQTRAWRQGQRYTVTEPLVFSPDGRVVWR